MYLSRLILNPFNRQVRRDLSDIRQMHRTIMSGFPRKPDAGSRVRQELGVLYRQETDPGTGRISVYVQSRSEPDWSGLPRRYLLDEPGLQNPACKRVSDRYGALRTGAQLFFRLRANPTRKIDTRTGPDGQRRHGKRVELRRLEDQMAWLRRKGEQSGFELLSVEVNPKVEDVRAVPDRRVTGLIELTDCGPPERCKHTITVVPVLFEGHLRITDAEKFLHDALLRGVGPGKAYGMGLLSIAPARR